ncbi:MAG: four-carbon acid sugar kinase family protein, partial [Pseudomonadota bacterium]
MILGVIADDFTGAADIANTLARGGMRTALYCRQPRGSAEPTIEAGVVALKCRTAPVEEAIRSALEALERLLDRGARQIVYKVCSTFDSTDSGNIGPVTEALADRLGAGAVPVCPAFPATGRRVFMGHLFVGDRLLSETGMASHPLTPMTDPNLRRVLARQSARPVSWFGLERVRGDGLADALAAEAGKLVLLDAIEDEDLHRIGDASADHVLLTGGSGIALGLPSLHLDNPG